MTGREKPKRRALHRGLDDIVNRDASLTSKLLGRVKPPSREPLEVPADDEALRAAESSHNEQPAAQTRPESSLPVKLRAQAEPAEVRRLDVARAESRAAAVGKADEAGERSVAAPAATSFDEFVARWGFVLRSGGRAGKLRICQVLYENTFGAGRDTFFTSYEKLARLTGLEKKQCAINVKQLESLGFVERLNIYNTATRQGTEFKLHLEQLPPSARRVPRHHYYDEDLPR
ncbi:MAG: hypothetical protein LC802_12385 [Acidobacteria bacterium]|nr:hypothetical protein [Acidobacteriota bacterium]